MSTSIGKLALMMSANPSGMVGGINQAKAAIGGLGSVAEATGAKARSLVADMAKIGGVGLGAHQMIHAAKAGMEFEKTMARVKALTNATADEFKALTHEAMELGTTTEFTSTQAGQAMSEFALAGFKTKEILQGIGPALRLATVGNVSLAQASSFAATVQRSMRMELSEFPKIVDGLAYAISNSMTDMNELSDAFKYVAPTARIAGMSFEETTAALMMLSDQGIRGSEAGTALRNMLKKSADQSDEARRLMDHLGLSFQDAQGNFKGFGVVLDELNGKLKGLGDMAKSEIIGTLFELRAGTGFSALLDQSAQYEDRVKRLKTEAGGTSGRIQKTQLDTMAGSWKFMTTSVEHFGIRLMEVLKGPLRGVMDSVTDIFRSLNHVMEAFKGLAPVFDMLGKGIQLALKPISIAFNAIGELIDKGIKGWALIIDEAKGGIAEILPGIGLLGKQKPERPGWLPLQKDQGEGQSGPAEDLLKKILQAPGKGFRWLAQRAETQRINIQAEMDLANAIRSTSDAMNKQLGSMRASMQSSAELYGLQVRGGTLAERKWQDVLQATKDFDGQLEDLRRKGAKGNQLDGILGMQQQARVFEFQKRMIDEAKTVWNDVRTPQEQFEQRQRDLSQLLQAQLLDWDTYTRAIRKAGMALEDLRAQTVFNAGEAITQGSAEAISVQNQVRFGQGKGESRVEQVLREQKIIMEQQRLAQQQLVDLQRRLLDRLLGGDRIPQG